MTSGTNVDPPSSESMRKRYIPGVQDSSIATSKLGDHAHSMVPVSGSISGSAWATPAKGPPRHTSRLPAPPYQPMRKARAVIDAASVLAMIGTVSPRHALSTAQWA